MATALGLLVALPAAAVSVDVGHSRLIEASDVVRVALGDGELAEVEVLGDGDGILLMGRAVGQTDLRIWSRDAPPRHLPVTVQPAPDTPRDRQLEQLAGRIDGIQLERIDAAYFVTGRPATDRDAARFERLVEAYPQLGDFTDPATAGDTPSVQVKARFVELRTSTLREIGLDWTTQSPAISFAYAADLETNDVFRGALGDFLPNQSLPLDIGKGNGYLGVGLSLTAMIDLLGQAGEARVIAEPMLSALSGTAAEFQAGGEVPIPIQNGDGDPTVVFKDYGILLKVAPVVGDDAHIRTRIEVEVSDVDESVTVLGVPGFSVRNAITEMSGPSGRTLLIAGLIDEQQSRAVSRVPGLGKLPVIGGLFRSERFQNEQTELVVLITPTLQDDPRADSPERADPSRSTPVPRLPLQEIRYE
ncbi:pilus assembly protein N-terminal domain-containing protein [Spiribacter sp. 1M153]|uniref:type II and III secretion system protein family protein n=1 Tax=Spiribacter roseus TaxID=1855875 RepID=UPI00349F9354